MKTVYRNKNDRYDFQIQNFLNSKKYNKNKYNYIEVKEYLRKKYNWVCCYCESKFDHWATSHIEHYYPKNFLNKNGDLIYSKFEHLLCNLHYSCPDCNSRKLDKSVNWKKCYTYKSWKLVEKHDKSYIFSPNFLLIWNKFKIPSYKVEDKFDYDFFEIKEVDTKNKRAKWTIKVLDLNWKEKRFYLREERIRIFNSALKLSENINNILLNEFSDCNNRVLNYLFQELSNMMDDSAPYSTMIKKQFWEIYVNLYDKYERLKKS